MRPVRGSGTFAQAVCIGFWHIALENWYGVLHPRNMLSVDALLRLADTAIGDR